MSKEQIFHFECSLKTRFELPRIRKIDFYNNFLNKHKDEGSLQQAAYKKYMHILLKNLN